MKTEDTGTPKTES